MDSKHVLFCGCEFCSFEAQWATKFIMKTFFVCCNFGTIFFQVGFGCLTFPILPEADVLFRSDRNRPRNPLLRAPLTNSHKVIVLSFCFVYVAYIHKGHKWMFWSFFSELREKKVFSLQHND